MPEKDRIIATTGCFDPLTLEELNYLKSCKLTNNKKIYFFNFLFYLLMQFNIINIFYIFTYLYIMSRMSFDL